MTATILQITTALALAVSTATALQFWAAVGEIPMTVPLRCRIPLTRNITCDVDDLISPSRVLSGEVAVGAHADAYCAPACKDSLKAFQSAVSSGCGHTLYKVWEDQTEGQSMKEVADGLAWAQEMLCLEDGYVLTLGTGQ